MRVLYKIFNEKSLTLEGFCVEQDSKLKFVSISEFRSLYSRFGCNNVKLGVKNGRVAFKGTEVGFSHIPGSFCNGLSRPAYFIVGWAAKATKDSPASYELVDKEGRHFIQNTQTIMRYYQEGSLVNAYPKKTSSGYLIFMLFRGEMSQSKLAHSDSNMREVRSNSAGAMVNPGTSMTNSSMINSPKVSAPASSNSEVKGIRAVMQGYIDKLNEASAAYYNSGRTIMSDAEYDKLYDELAKLEASSGVVLAGSPTQNVGAAVVSKLDKKVHEVPSLSLNKTKGVTVLANSLGGQLGVLSIKLDGLTGVATYENGKLVSLATRGNGKVGEDITHNASSIKGLPLQIPTKEKLIVRGEMLISYLDFDRINNSLPVGTEPYKNPRNLASGTARLLDSKDVKTRGLTFVAFSVAKGLDSINSHYARLETLASYGFKSVPAFQVLPSKVGEMVKWFEDRVKTYEFPSDGLVLTIDDVLYGESLGRTAKFPRNAMAFKWRDETYATVLRNIDWSVSRTGVITPVAEFDPVDIDGSVVRRASVHNVSIFKQLKLGLGDEVGIYKANMIIPQVAKNNTMSGTCVIPNTCSCCGGKAEVTKDNESEILVCLNKNCPAKFTGFFEHLVDKSALNVVGVSTSILEALIRERLVLTPADFMNLSIKEAEIRKLDGMAGRATTKLLEAIDKAKVASFENFLVSLGIPLVGKTAAGKVAGAVDYDVLKLCSASKSALMSKGLGERISENIEEYMKGTWFDGEPMSKVVKDYASLLTFSARPVVQASAITGMAICITGSLVSFPNRREFEDYVKANGGTLTSSVSSKTNILVTNDTQSGSAKNMKAKELGITVMDELSFKAFVESKKNA